RWRRLYDRIFWVPPNCRWDTDAPPKFSMPLNILFAFAASFTVANLYYSHPILNILARDFGVPYAKVSQIPTVAQAGYAGGLFFLCPLGDLLKRRPFVLSLVFVTATVSIGLCVTKSFEVFSGIQFIIGFTTVTPQLMLPLVGDLAPPHRRAAALSIVVSGFVLGILVARLLSGIVAFYVSWRYVYWLSVGLQYAIFASLWLFMPDYPSTNKRMNYFKMLWSMLVMVAKHPVLVQASLVALFTSSTFTSFWTVLTFLLADPPYNYNSVDIGLFALIGISAMFLMPLYGRYIIDRFVPWFSVILGMFWCMLGICIGAYTGSFTVAGPILQAWFLDIGLQSSQVANRSSIFSIEPKARNRVNTVFMVCVFCGQLMGTSIGAHIYARAGWEAAQSYSVAAIGVALLITFARGPYESRWVGWRGGLSIFKRDRASADG
ncbi:major facilitator superfamily domain-containing protein, partial [Neohortaea acidophila]